MKQVYTASNIVDAQIFKDYLCGAGLEAIIKGEFLTGAVGELPTNTYPTVWVIDEDLFDKAKELLKIYEAPRPSDQVFHDSWTCPACGEWMESQFTECWRCGRQRI